MTQTFGYYAMVFYKRFAAYTARRVQSLGLNFGALFLVLYVGRHPGCTQAELTEALGLDWGYSQRSIKRLEEEGFLSREKDGRAFHLTLSQRGQEAFAVSHQVFHDWDADALAVLTPEEQAQLLHLLGKIKRKEANDQACTIS